VKNVREKREAVKVEGEAQGDTVAGAERGQPGTATNGDVLASESPEKRERWTAKRKRDAVLRLLRGETLEALSRELGVEPHKLAHWRDHAIFGMEASLTARDVDRTTAELEAAMRRVGELTMEVELLRERCKKKGPFVRQRWKP
jgi:hypothetical protein